MTSNERAIPELDLSWQAFLGNQLAPLAGHEYDVARRAYVASWYASRAYAARSRDETPARLAPLWSGDPPGSLVTETPRDAQDAARYRFLREPGNAIVYAKSRNAWGRGGSGHVRYDTALQLDIAIDAERGAVKTSCDDVSVTTDQKNPTRHIEIIEVVENGERKYVPREPAPLASNLVAELRAIGKGGGGYELTHAEFQTIERAADELERRVPETSRDAENLAEALERYLNAHDIRSGVQSADEATGQSDAHDSGFVDVENEAWRVMRAALYKYRKQAAMKTGEKP